MTETIPYLINRILDAISAFLKAKNGFFKFLLFIIFVALLWFLNDSTEFIRNYRISNKIRNIKELESIIQSKGIDSLTKANLKQIQYSIIQRESVLERLYLLFQNSDTQLDSIVSPNAGIEQSNKTQHRSLKVAIDIEFNIWLHIFCSSWFGVILLAFSIIWLIRERRGNIKAPFILIFLSIINISIFSIITYIIVPKDLDLLVSCLIKALFYTVIQLLLLIAIIPNIQEHEEKITSKLGL